MIRGINTEKYGLFGPSADTFNNVDPTKIANAYAYIKALKSRVSGMSGANGLEKLSFGTLKLNLGSYTTAFNAVNKALGKTSGTADACTVVLQNLDKQMNLFSKFDDDAKAIFDDVKKGEWTPDEVIDFGEDLYYVGKKRDKDGNLIQKKDENGNPMFDEDGNPIYEDEKKSAWKFSWGSPKDLVGLTQAATGLGKDKPKNTIFEKKYGKESEYASNWAADLYFRLHRGHKDSEAAAKDVKGRLVKWADEKAEKLENKIFADDENATMMGPFGEMLTPTALAKTLVKDINDIKNPKTGKAYSESEYRAGKKMKYANVSIASIGTSWSGGLATTSGSTKKYNEKGEEVFSASGSLGLGVASASASATITPSGLKVEASAEASLLHADGSVSVGNKNLGAGLSGSVDVGHVYAGAKVVAGKQADGSWELGAHGEIGADLVSASGSANVNLAGVKATVSGSVKVGLSAEANVGLVDGVLDVHIGAALGVGFDIGFSVDVGGAIDNLKETKVGKAVTNFVSNGWQAVKGWFGG